MPSETHGDRTDLPCRDLIENCHVVGRAVRPSRGLDFRAATSPARTVSRSGTAGIRQGRGWVIAGEYVERMSGSKDSMPQLDRLMAAARERRLDIILCWKLDRWAAACAIW
jgi:hypothetical protein